MQDGQADRVATEQAMSGAPAPREMPHPSRTRRSAWTRSRRRRPSTPAPADPARPPTPRERNTPRPPWSTRGEWTTYRPARGHGARGDNPRRPPGPAGSHRGRRRPDAGSGERGAPGGAVPRLVAIDSSGSMHTGAAGRLHADGPHQGRGLHGRGPVPSTTRWDCGRSRATWTGRGSPLLGREGNCPPWWTRHPQRDQLAQDAHADLCAQGVHGLHHITLAAYRQVLHDDARTTSAR
ncbi:hypothetical protein QJS66_15660 [Kocuria rhizophila]|nr:hypothetical protein QJS66_15660 [Kocuria rhizophila]